MPGRAREVRQVAKRALNGLSPASAGRRCPLFKDDRTTLSSGPSGPITAASWTPRQALDPPVARASRSAFQCPGLPGAWSPNSRRPRRDKSAVGERDVDGPGLAVRRGRGAHGAAVRGQTQGHRILAVLAREMPMTSLRASQTGPLGALLLARAGEANIMAVWARVMWRMNTFPSCGEGERPRF